MMIGIESKEVVFYLVRRGRKRKSRIRKLEKECTLFSNNQEDGIIYVSPDGKLYYVVD